MKTLTRTSDRASGLGRGGRAFFIPISNGLLEHCPRMGNAIWLFLWLIDRTTKEMHDKGIVLGGKPVRDRDIAAALGAINERTIRRWRKVLLVGDYIEALNTGHGYSYRVLKTKKWSNKTDGSADKSVRSDRPESVGLIGQNGQVHIDSPVDNTVVVKPTAASIPETKVEEKEILKLWNYYLDAFDKDEPLTPPRKKMGLDRLRQMKRDLNDDPTAYRMSAAIDMAKALTRNPKKYFFKEWHSIFGNPDTFASLIEQYDGLKDPPPAAAKGCEQEQVGQSGAEAKLERKSSVVGDIASAESSP